MAESFAVEAIAHRAILFRQAIFLCMLAALDRRFLDGYYEFEAVKHSPRLLNALSINPLYRQHSLLRKYTLQWWALASTFARRVSMYRP